MFSGWQQQRRHAKEMVPASRASGSSYSSLSLILSPSNLPGNPFVMSWQKSADTGRDINVLKGGRARNQMKTSSSMPGVFYLVTELPTQERSGWSSQDDCEGDPKVDNVQQMSKATI